MSEKEEKKDEKKDEKEDEKKDDDKGKEGDDKGKEGDKKDDKKEDDACKKDVKSPDCIGEKLVKNIDAAFNKPGELAMQVAKDAATKVMDKAKRVFTDKSECVKFFVKEIPNFIPHLIDESGKSASGSIDKITNSLKNLFGELAGKDIPGYPNIIPPLETLYASGMMKLQSKINTAILGSEGDKMMADPKTKPKVLLKQFEASSVNFKKMISDEQFQDVFKKWMINYTSAFAETLNLAKPQLEHLKAMIGGVVEDISKKIGTTLGKALVDVIKSVIGEIPVFGGVADLIISAGQLGDNIVRSCLPAVSKGAGAVLPALNIANRKYAETKHDIDCLVKQIEPILKKMEQKGGAYNEPDKKIKIARATKRVKKMLSHFTRRHTKPINYEKRILKFRRG